MKKLIKKFEKEMEVASDKAEWHEENQEVIKLERAKEILGESVLRAVNSCKKCEKLKDENCVDNDEW
jgi:hypothetical protein